MNLYERRFFIACVAVGGFVGGVMVNRHGLAGFIVGFLATFVAFFLLLGFVRILASTFRRDMKNKKKHKIGPQ